MNNKEYLIQILLKLRSIGIKNNRILGSIEKIPPHFYYNLLNSSEDIKNIDIDEVLEIAKLLQLSLNDNYKHENILLFGFKNGWLLLLLTNFCKRVYGICNSMAHKKKLEELFTNNNYKNENILLLGFKSGWLLLLLTNFCKRVYGICNSMAHKKKLEIFFLNNNYKNIYLCHGENILSWSRVAPFDLIFIFEKNDFLFDDIISQLSCKGQGIIPSIIEKNKISMISIDKENLKTNQNCNCDLLINSDLI